MAAGGGWSRGTIVRKQRATNVCSALVLFIRSGITAHGKVLLSFRVSLSTSASLPQIPHMPACWSHGDSESQQFDSQN